MKQSLACLFIILTLLHLNAEATSSSASLFNRQWGLLNTGQTFYRETGELTRQELRGVLGEDINWATSQKLQEIIQERSLNPKEQVVIAVIDSGIEKNHPAFRDRLWFNERLCADLSEEQQATEPCYGWNFLNGNSDLTDDLGHGTHISGIIAANSQTSLIQGAAGPFVKIMPLKVLNRDVQGLTYQNRVVTDIIADAISFAVQNGADVINLSLGWPELIHIPKINFAISRAIELGVVVVAATGNNNKDVPTYPCNLSGVICVGAHDHQGQVSEFSNYSGKVDLVAPGENIISAHPRTLESRSLRIHGYETKQGSSQAAPFVSAAVAAIRHLYPDSSVGEVRARLFNSAREVHGKPVKYGALNMLEALKTRPEVFIRPDFKNLLDVALNEQGQFIIDLPIVNELERVEDIAVSVRVSQSAISLDQTQFSIDRLPQGGRRVLRVRGEVSDLTIESEQRFFVEIRADNFEADLDTNIIFTRNIELIKEQTLVNSIKGVHPDHISFFNGPQKISRLRRVTTATQDEMNQAWFYQDPTKQGPTRTSVTLIESSSTGAEVTLIELPERVAQVLAVFIIDINLDGHTNLVVYSMDQARQNLVLDVFDEHGELLSGPIRRFSLPITSFEGLPLRPSGEDFTWLKVELPQLGPLLVPSFIRRYILPEEDNTVDILDRLPVTNAERLYYLMPELTGDQLEFTIRTLQGIDFNRKLQSMINVRFNDEVTLMRPFEQSKLERSRGVLKSLLLVGRESQRRAYQITFVSAGQFTLKPLHIGVHQLDSNLIRRLIEPQQKDFTDTLAAMGLISREHARLITLDANGNMSDQRHQIKNESYSDPYFQFLGGVEQDGAAPVLFMESRYHLQAFSRDYGMVQLPINRESSFPGMNFTELFAVHLAEGRDGQKLPAITVNATQVFGDRLYAMVYAEGSFTRPIDLSLSLPAHCLPLNGGRSAQGSHLTLLCRDRQAPLMDQMSIRLIPLRTDL